MPTVKTYGNTQVAMAPAPNVRFTAAPTDETFGVSMGNKVAAVGAKLYDDEILKQDQIAVLEADRKLSEWENKRLYDPKEGALAKRGKDAFGLPDVVGKDFDTFRDELRGALSNERQRAAFDRQALSRRSDIDKSLSRHVFTEIRKFDDTETENYIRNSMQSAISNASDPQRVMLEIERQTAAVVDFANRNGLGTEYIKQKAGQARSNTHVGVVDRMLASGQDLAAKSYFDTIKHEIAGDDIAKVEKALNEGSVRGEAQRRTDRILSGLPPSPEPSRPSGMLEQGNVDLTNRPRVRNADGSVSTIRSMSFNEDGKEILIPTVSESGRIMSDDQAIAEYRRTGKHLGKFSNPDDATKFAKSLSQGQAAMIGSEQPKATAETLLPIVLNLESRGRRFDAAGNVLTSPKGARGEMQVMDATNRDPGYGVRPARDNSLDERARVGRDYLAAMVKEYNGDAGKALAAYNAGPGAVNEAVAKYGDRWIEHMPAETKRYVSDGLLQAGMSQAVARKTPELTQESALELARQETDPKIRDEMERRIVQHFDRKRVADRERKEGLLTEAANIIDRTGSVDSIPPSTWTSLTVSERASLEAYAKRHNKSEEVKTDLATYYSLEALASSPATRDAFARTNLLQYVNKLSPADFKHLSAAQAALRKGDDKEANKLLSSERVQRQIIDDAVLSMGLDPTPNEKTPESKRKQILEFRRAVREQVSAHEQRTGKNATDADVQSIVDGLIVKGKVPGSGWFFEDERRVYELKEGERLVIKPADVPRAERIKIEDALRKHGRAVTDDAVVTLYTARLLGSRARPTQPAPPSMVDKIPGQAPRPPAPPSMVDRIPQ